MLSRTSPAGGPDRDSLPLKKRDQRWSLPPSLQRQQPCDRATFKAPYPHRSCAESRFKHASPFRPFPKRVPSLHQPWMQAHAPTTSIPQVVSAFRAHQGWADWRGSKPLHIGWEGGHSFQHLGHPSPSLQVGQRPPRFTTASGIGDAFQSTGDGEQLWGHNLNARRDIDERNGGPFLKRSRKAESLPDAGHPSLTTGPTRSPQQVLKLQSSAKLFRGSTSRRSFPTDCERANTNVSVREVMPGSPPPDSRAPNRLPWLLPHFLAGSLIELRDGRLRRVEHLQTEDFLLGALACPDLRLSCCTVQSIAISTSSATSRLLILLHDQQSQVNSGLTLCFHHPCCSSQYLHLSNVKHVSRSWWTSMWSTRFLSRTAAGPPAALRGPPASAAFSAASCAWGTSAWLSPHSRPHSNPCRRTHGPKHHPTMWNKRANPQGRRKAAFPQGLDNWQGSRKSWSGGDIDQPLN